MAQNMTCITNSTITLAQRKKKSQRKHRNARGIYFIQCIGGNYSKRKDVINECVTFAQEIGIKILINTN